MCVEFETYKTELEEIKLTQDSKKALVKALTEREPEQKTKRPVRPLRVALIAACVCLALVGTAFAATVGFFGIFSTSNGDGTVTREYREVIFLRYYEEYSVKEIAGLLGIPAPLVSTRLKRAKEKLKKMLGGIEYVCRI